MYSLSMRKKVYHYLVKSLLQGILFYCTSIVDAPPLPVEPHRLAQALRGGYPQGLDVVVMLSIPQLAVLYGYCYVSIFDNDEDMYEIDLFVELAKALGVPGLK